MTTPGTEKVQYRFRAFAAVPRASLAPAPSTPSPDGCESAHVSDFIKEDTDE